LQNRNRLWSRPIILGHSDTLLSTDAATPSPAGQRKQAESASSVRTYIADETAQQKQGTAFFVCPSLNEGTRLQPFSTGEAEPDEASVGMRNPESLRPFAADIQPILWAKRENENNRGRCLDKKSST